MPQTAVIHENHAFLGHHAVINTVCFHRGHDSLVSSDDTSLQLWRRATGELLRHISLPPRTSQFIQCLVSLAPKPVYVAAALDGTLKLLDLDLNELASVSTGRRGAILCLAFDANRQRLYTGGVDGCTAWKVRSPSAAATGEHTINPQYELAVIPHFFHSSSNSSSSSNTTAKPLTWVQSLQLSVDGARVYAQSAHGVDAFRGSDGTLMDAFRELFPSEHGAITALAVQASTQSLLCGTMDGVLWVVAASHPPCVLHSFHDHTTRITGLALLPETNLLLSSSLDGTVRVWDLDARRVTHRVELHEPVHALALLGSPSGAAGASSASSASASASASSSSSTSLSSSSSGPCQFFCRVRHAVRLFTVQSAATEHLASLAPISILQRVVFPMVMPEEALGESGRRRRPHRRISMAVGGRGGRDGRGGGDGGEEMEVVEENRASGWAQRQWLMAAGTDKTVRLFAGRTPHESPSFTWIPEESALDVIGVALHAVGDRLYLLLDSQRILSVDISPQQKRRQEEEEEEEEERASAGRMRTILLDATPSGIATGKTVRQGFRHRSSTSIAAAATTTAAAADPSASLSAAAKAATAATTGRDKKRNSVVSSPVSPSSITGNLAATPVVRGAIRCLCACYYPPLFRAVGDESGAASVSAIASGIGTATPMDATDEATQLKSFSRTFATRRQQSKRDLKRVDDLPSGHTDSHTNRHIHNSGHGHGGAASVAALRHKELQATATAAATTATATAAPPLVQSSWQWLACGSEFGHLVFWHSGLSSSFREALALDAHDAAIVSIHASASSALLISLDAGQCVNVWMLQPVLALRQVVKLHAQPTCVALSLHAEILLTGYEDGAVSLLHATSRGAEQQPQQPLRVYEDSDENHAALVTAGDFLDGEGLVVTASVDAVVRVWDQCKTPLRCVQLAMALTTFCFMNEHGDLLAGVATGIFFLPRGDVLPEKRKAMGQPLQQAQLLLQHQHQCGCQSDHSVRSGGQAAAVVASIPPDEKEAGAGAGISKTEEKTTRDDDEGKPGGAGGGEGDEGGGRGDSDGDEGDDDDGGCKSNALFWPERVESAPKSMAPSRTQTKSRLGISWTRAKDTSSARTPLDKPMGALHPPVLRPSLPTITANPNNQQQQSPHQLQHQHRSSIRAKPTPSASPPPPTDDDGPCLDWRDVLAPSPLRSLTSTHGASPRSPRHTLHPGNTRRRRVPSPATAATIAELRALRTSHSHSPIHSPRSVSSVPSPCTPSLPRSSPSSTPRSSEGTTTATATTTTTTLGIGLAQSMLQYGKHQGPVTAVNPTPRTLWNAIGGEDRRLLALQRSSNLPTL